MSTDGILILKAFLIFSLVELGLILLYVGLAVLQTIRRIRDRLKDPGENRR